MGSDSKQPIRLGYTHVSAEAKGRILEALDAGAIAQDRWVRTFEEVFADCLGRRYCVATSSGTMALAIAFAAVRDSVSKRATLKASTFPATANAAYSAGYIALAFYDTFAAPEWKYGLLVPTHVLGIPEGGSWPYWTIEDACEALGSTKDGVLVGRVGSLAACFSFFVTHTVRSGEGGCVVCDDEGLADAMRGLRDHGRTGVAPRYTYNRPGFNAKMTSLEAILALDSLLSLDENGRVRRTNAAWLDSQFGHKWLQDGVVPHAYPIFYASETARDAALNRLIAAAIEARPYFPCLPVSTWCKDYVTGLTSWPNSESNARCGLYVPIHEGLAAEDLRRIASVAQALVLA